MREGEKGLSCIEHSAGITHGSGSISERTWIVDVLGWGPSSGLLLHDF